MAYEGYYKKYGLGLERQPIVSRDINLFRYLKRDITGVEGTYISKTLLVSFHQWICMLLELNMTSSVSTETLPLQLLADWSSSETGMVELLAASFCDRVGLFLEPRFLRGPVVPVFSTRERLVGRTRLGFGSKNGNGHFPVVFRLVFRLFGVDLLHTGNDPKL